MFKTDQRLLEISASPPWGGSVTHAVPGRHTDRSTAGMAAFRNPCSFRCVRDLQIASDAEATVRCTGVRFFREELTQLAVAVGVAFRQNDGAAGVKLGQI